MNWFFYPLAGFLVLLAALVSLAAVARRFWVATTGKVSSHELSRGQDEEGKRFLTIRVYYKYQIEDGRYFEGEDSLHFEPAYHEEDELVADLEQKYSVGSVIDVFHPSSRPYLSRISRDIELGKVLLPIATALLIVACVYIYHHIRMQEVLNGTG